MSSLVTLISYSFSLCVFLGVFALDIQLRCHAILCQNLELFGSLMMPRPEYNSVFPTALYYIYNQVDLKLRNLIKPANHKKEIRKYI